VYYPAGPGNIGEVNVTMVFAGEGRVQWANIGWFHLAPMGCACEAKAWARPRYLAGRTRISVDECRVLSGTTTNTSGRYEILDTHTPCTDTTFISTAPECQKAAKYVGLPWNSCCKSDKSLPYGCIKRGNGDDNAGSAGSADADVVWNGLAETGTTLASASNRWAVCRVPVLEYNANSNGTCVECKRCPAGYSCTGGLKVRCGAGFHSYGGQEVCTPCNTEALRGHICGNGLVTPCLGSSYADHANGACVPCPAGSQCGRGVRAYCNAGRWSPPLASTCPICKPGRFSHSAGSASCTLCNAGRTSNVMRDHCLDCQPGHFALTPGTHPCNSCTAGKFAASAKSETCAECPEGKYGPSDKEGLTLCSTCPKGQVLSSTNAGVSCMNASALERR